MLRLLAFKTGVAVEHLNGAVGYVMQALIWTCMPLISVLVRAGVFIELLCDAF